MYPLVGRLDRNRRTLGLVRISIHAPLAGCDHSSRGNRALLPHFKPRTPCGVRQQSCFSGATTSEFQSTHPLRGATRCPGAIPAAQQISIHAPLAGCDGKRGRFGRHGGHFNPRTPCGVRPVQRRVWPVQPHFNPRTPCGVRRGISFRAARGTAGFQSTHPLRGATCGTLNEGQTCRFQSTHPLRGATDQRCPPPMGDVFQSTHPLRGATRTSPDDHNKLLFQSTHPLRGATQRRARHYAYE